MKSDLSALEKCSPFLWGSQSYRKARQTKSFQGTLKGLEGTVVNTVVAQSVGVLLTWYLKSSKWPLEAAQWEAVLSILWKFPSPDAAGRSPMGWELVCLWSFKMSSCLWACLHLLASEFVALKNMEVHPKLSLPAQDEEGSQHGAGGCDQLHAAEERLCGSCARLCTESKDLRTGTLLATCFLLAGH